MSKVGVSLLHGICACGQILRSYTFIRHKRTSGHSANTAHICGYCREIKVNEFTSLFVRRHQDCPTVNLDVDLVKKLAAMSNEEQEDWNEDQQVARACTVARSLPRAPRNHEVDLDASAGEPRDIEPAAVKCVSVGIQTRSASCLRILKRQVKNNTSTWKLRQRLTAGTIKHLRGKISFLQGRLSMEIRRRRRGEGKRSAPSSNYWRCHIDLPKQTDAMKHLIFECDGEVNSLTIRRGVQH